MSNKKGLEIDFGNKIKLNIFSHTEENLFIDLLVKQDEEAREKTGEVLWNLNIIEDYVDIILDDLGKILKVRDGDYSKKVSFELSDKEKRDYMEQKFDFIEKKGESKIDIKIDFIKKGFPSLGDKDNISDIKGLFFQEDPKKGNIIKLINIKTLDNIKGKILLFPLLFPKIEKGKIIWTLKTFKIKKDFNQIKDENKELKEEGFNEEEKINNEKKIINLFNSFIILDKELKKDENLLLANYLLPKTNLFCDYRWINKEMFN